MPGVGSAGAGIVGYVLALFLGKSATKYLASEEELERFRTLFDKWGGMAIIISRVMPILPEVMAILAGLANMSLGRFLTALFLGTIPTCFLFSYMGYASRTDPGYGIILAVLIPLAIWPLFLRFALAKQRTVT
jgi:membrane protein DedA with SNARE-associated domain